MTDRPTFTVGIEEEYLITDKRTRDLVDRIRGFWRACPKRWASR